MYIKKMKNRPANIAVAAYQLYPSWETTEMYKDVEDMPGVCPVCHNTVELIPNLEYKSRKKIKDDFIVTHDGFYLVSQKFKDFCDKYHYEGLTFQELPLKEGYYFFLPNDVFPLDAIKSNLHFDGYRDCCGSYDYTQFQGFRYCPKDYQVPSERFIKHTPFLFGDKYRKDFALIASLDTPILMEAYGLKGCCFDEIYQEK